MRTSLSLTWLALAAASLAGVLFTGCGGGGGGGGSSSNGHVAVSLTDAPADRLEVFEVGLASIELIHESGALVPVAPARARVDLTDLVTTADLIAARPVPVGTYTGALLGLDLSQARVVIAGKATPARVADTLGVTLGGVVRRAALFEPGRRLSVTAGAQRLVELDLDLDQSCLVDDATNTVRLGPVLSAVAAPTTPRPQRLAGAVAGVDSAAGTLTLALPSPPGAPAAVTVRADGATQVLIDGEAADLAALAARPAGLAVEVLAQAETTAGAFLARTVDAWAAADTVTGVITGRTAAGALTVQGATITRATGQRQTGQTVTVAAGAATKIARAGATTALTLADVAVGQRVVARGALAGSTLTATGAGGHVVLLETPLFGHAVGPASSGQLALNVARIAGRPIADFDFRIDGTATADPTQLLVTVTGLPTSTIVASTPVALRAQLAAWTAPAGQPDAVAASLADRAATASVLRADWQAPSATPFTAASGTGVTLDLQTTQARTLDTGLASPTTLAPQDRPQVVPAGASGLYLLVDGGVTTPHTSFSAWHADLVARLAAGARARAITAVGRWDASGSGTLQARAVTLLLE
ncbi:MAG: DUF4382 domain-containing protein [Planctomycetes bacterium]|nr:DUF4382 domain-containing protein [Planctomycetota bacterium]